MFSPIGVARYSDQLNEFIGELKQRWDNAQISFSSKGTAIFGYITTFLLDSLDRLIVFIDVAMDGEAGADKKATVMAAIAILYDYISVAFPFWLKPFAPMIKKFIIYTLIAIAVDWIVAKYKDGSWGNKLPA